MFENNGFAFDSAGSFFGESTTPSFGNGFSNAGPSDGFFSESAFDGNGFSTPETSVFGESASYGGGFTQFGSAFSESTFGEDGFSADGMFCEGDNSVDSDKKGDYIDKHKGENRIHRPTKVDFLGDSDYFLKAGLARIRGDDQKRDEEGMAELRRHQKKRASADEVEDRLKKDGSNKK